MKKIFFVVWLLMPCIMAMAQTTVEVKFYYNAKLINIDKEQVRFGARDTVKIIIQSKDFINVEELWVQPFNLKMPGSPQQQQKQVLVAGDYKKYKGFSKLKSYTFKIPMSAFSAATLSRLKFNIINCTNQKGDKLFRNNKVYELVSSNVR